MILVTNTVKGASIVAVLSPSFMKVIGSLTAPSPPLPSPPPAGILPLLGVELDKEEDGIGDYIHHPVLSLPLKLGVVAMVMGYVIVAHRCVYCCTLLTAQLSHKRWTVILTSCCPPPPPPPSTSLLMVGARTLDQLDMLLPTVALGLILFVSIGFARDRVGTCHHVTVM